MVKIDLSWKQIPVALMTVFMSHLALVRGPRQQQELQVHDAVVLNDVGEGGVSPPVELSESVEGGVPHRWVLVGAELQDGVEEVELFGRTQHDQVLHEADPHQGSGLTLAELLQQSDGIVSDYWRLQVESPQDILPVC